MTKDLQDTIIWGVEPMSQNTERYVIYNMQTGLILDNAQGYGFTSSKSAYKYGRNKYKTNGMCMKNESNDLF